MGETYKSFADAEVICPFYKGVENVGFTLRCEGAIGNSILAHKFFGEQARDRHMSRYCKSFRYGKCPISRLLEEKYAAG